MFQRFFVRPVLLGGKLAGTLVELRGHVGGFLRRAAERDEDLGKLGKFHGLFDRITEFCRMKSGSFFILQIL